MALTAHANGKPSFRPKQLRLTKEIVTCRMLTGHHNIQPSSHLAQDVSLIAPYEIYCRVTVKEPFPPVLLTKVPVKVLLFSVAVPVKLNEPKLKDRFKVVPDMVPETVPTPEPVDASAHVVLLRL